MAATSAFGGKPLKLVGHSIECAGNDPCTCAHGRALRAEQVIREGGYSLRWVEYCEDAWTPGLLGQIAGVTDRGLREVKIATRGRSEEELAATLEHEARHVAEPEWDCGNRDVFGRGGRS